MPSPVPPTILPPKKQRTVGHGSQRRKASGRPKYVPPERRRNVDWPVVTQAEKGARDPFGKFGITQEEAARRSNAIQATYPKWYRSDAQRKARVGKKHWKTTEFHDWLWRFTISHGKNRLPKDHFLREFGITIDPFQVMKSLHKNAGLTKKETVQWEEVMAEMEAYREQQERLVEPKPEPEPKPKRPRGRPRKNQLSPPE